ncbi:MAG: hypothetical protein ACRDRN_20205 [Sciscionella sp.]
MTLLAVERIKLFTTRSPWWCMLLTVALTVGFAVLFAVNANVQAPPGVEMTQIGYQFGLVVIMVMAALAVTTEYRTGTIRATFQAIPNRVAALLAKTVVVALVAGVVGEVTAWASWGVAKLIKPELVSTVTTEQQWRNVAGVGLLYLVGAVIAVAVGILLRHTAGAVAVLLIYVLLVESLVQLIPKIGVDIYKWMPFNVGGNFLTGGLPARNGGPPGLSSTSTLGPWWSLLYFVGFAVVLLVAALVSATKRDA